MCGIAGVLNGRGRPAVTEVLEAMVATLHHRGPDHAGVLTKGPVGLAAARLAIVDPGPSGDQPLADAHAALTFNGELYNRDTLAEALEGEGVRFRGHSDTEVLFHALCRWGVDATLPRLSGMFAFAFVDLDLDRVWLARDPLGIKPLVWTSNDGNLAWASEAKALAHVRTLTPDPIQALFGLTGRIERSAERTAFTGVRQVPAGHVLRADAGREPNVAPWWRLADLVDESLHRELAALDPASIVDRFDALLTAAVTDMAGSDVPMGTFVSGGVDSSLLASLAPRPRPSLFCADVGGDRSEAAAARTVADHLGQALTLAPFPREALLDDWALATWHAEAPVVTHVNSLPFRRLAATAQTHGVKAVLTGEGADELFFGYGEIGATSLARLADRSMATARRAVARLPGPLGAALTSRSTGQADFLVDLVGGFRYQQLTDEGAEAFSFLAPKAAARHGEVFVWLGEHLPTLLHRNDAMGMAASIETRFPYLADEVVRFGVNLPVEAKLEPSRRVGDHRHPFLVDKAVVRRTAARHLPAAVAKREKAGFPMYGHAHVRTTAAFWADGYVVDLLGLPRSAVAHLVDETEPYLAAKLASVEIFGRIFAEGNDTETVADHLRCSAQVT